MQSFIVVSKVCKGHKIFVELQVKKGEEMMKSPEHILFLPTELFSAVLSQEFTTMVENNEEVGFLMLCFHGVV